MLLLTPRERKIILFIGGLILTGSILRFSRNARGPKEEIVLVKEFININSAAIQELEKIPGIGPVMANRIIEYRLKGGAFKTIEDLKKVKGIGDKKASIIATHIKF
ncbi:MAG: helix-hairpin-helix domain-containing protein [Candidatus Omnitrophota bacterium]|nr:MAG: helix-hairpin-helix domain-containing protein [Candidatus Omnitrophota bacterium]